MSIGIPIKRGPSGPAGSAGSTGIAFATAPLVYNSSNQNILILPATNGSSGTLSASDKIKLDTYPGTFTPTPTPTLDSVLAAGNISTHNLSAGVVFATTGTFAGNVSAPAFIGSGSFLTGLPVPGIDSVLAAGSDAAGADLTGVSNLAAGSLNVSGGASIGSGLTVDAAGDIINGYVASNIVQANQFQGPGVWNSAELELPSNNQILWSHNPNPFDVPDVGLARASAGVLKITDGNSGLGSISAAGATFGNSTDATLTLSQTSFVASNANHLAINAYALNVNTIAPTAFSGILLNYGTSIQSSGNGALQTDTSNIRMLTWGAEQPISIQAYDAIYVALQVNGVAGQTANLQNWADSSGDILAGVSSNGTISAAGATFAGNITLPSSFAIGGSATSTGTGTIAIGQGASAADSISGRNEGVAIGYVASAVGFGTAIGGGAVAGEQGTAIGSGAVAGVAGVAIGQSVSNSDGLGVAIGGGSSTGQTGTAIGFGATSGAGGVAIGRVVTADGAGTAIGFGATATNGIAIALSANGESNFLEFDSAKNATFAAGATFSGPVNVQSTTTGDALSSSGYMGLSAYGQTILSLGPDASSFRTSFLTVYGNVQTDGGGAFQNAEGNQPTYVWNQSALPTVIGSNSTSLSGSNIDMALPTSFRSDVTIAGNLSAGSLNVSGGATVGGGLVISSVDSGGYLIYADNYGSEVHPGYPFSVDRFGDTFCRDLVVSGQLTLRTPTYSAFSINALSYETDDDPYHPCKIDTNNRTTASDAVLLASGTYTHVSGSPVAAHILPTFSSTGTAGWTALAVDPQQLNDSGSGNRLLADFRLNGVSKASVDTSGNVSAAGNLNIGGTTTFNGPVNLSTVNTTITPGTVDQSVVTDVTLGLSQWNAGASAWDHYFRTPRTPPSVTGSKSSGAAFASLMSTLVGLGLITDGTST